MASVFLVNECKEVPGIPVGARLGDILRFLPPFYDSASCFAILEDGTLPNRTVASVPMYIFHEYKTTALSTNQSTEKLNYVVDDPDPSSFRGFGLAEWYDEKFSMDISGRWPAGYERLPVVDEQIFNLQCEAKDMYARYMTNMQFLAAISSALRIKYDSSIAACNYTEKYLEVISQRIEQFQRSFTEFEGGATHACQMIISAPELPPNLAASLSPLSIAQQFLAALQKLREKAEKILTIIDTQEESINKTVNAVRQLQNQAHRFQEDLRNLDFQSLEFTIMTLMHNCVNKYNEFRHLLQDKVLNAQSNARRQAADRCLELENELGDLIAQIRELQPKVDHMAQMIETAKMLKTKCDIRNRLTMKTIVKIQSTLRHVVKIKLVVNQRALEQLRADYMSLPVPSVVVQGLEEAERERQRRFQAFESISSDYMQLQKRLALENAEQGKFLSAYGSKIPVNLAPDLAASILTFKRLKSPPIAPDQQQRLTESEQIAVAYYENMMGLQTRAYEARIDQLQSNLSQVVLRLREESRNLAEAEEEKERLRRELYNLKSGRNRIE